VHVKLETVRLTCDRNINQKNYTAPKDWWLCIVIMLLSLGQFVSTIYYFLTLSNYMQKLQTDYEKKMEEILGT